MSAEVDEESLVLSSGGLPHGLLAMMNKAVKHTLTTTFTRLKAGLTKDSPPLPPRRRARQQPAYDPDFEAAYAAAHQEYQVAFNRQQQQFTEYMAYIHASMLANQTGQTVDLGPMPPFPGPAPNYPSKENFATEYYGRTAYADGWGQPSAHSVYADGRRYAEGHVCCAEANLPRRATPRAPVGVAYAEGEAVLRRGLEAVGILADSCSS
ncbi:uncharacterized protein [Lolium perenne]|uniref:uncharacterized protein n=1 Tax=Lolium perenne TaxID=4522 RepID=UPI003A99B415